MKVSCRLPVIKLDSVQELLQFSHSHHSCLVLSLLFMEALFLHVQSVLYFLSSLGQNMSWAASMSSIFFMCTKKGQTEWLIKKHNAMCRMDVVAVL